jgi:hypothetical protein
MPSILVTPSLPKLNPINHDFIYCCPQSLSVVDIHKQVVCHVPPFEAMDVAYVRASRKLTNFHVTHVVLPDEITVFRLMRS